MEGEGDRQGAGGGIEEPAGAKLEVSLVDLMPMPATNKIELANLPGTRTNTDVSEPMPKESKEHYYQRVYRANFEGRIENARLINSSDPTEIQNAIKPNDFIKIKANNQESYFRVLDSGIITNGVSHFDLKDILNEALKHDKVEIMRAPPKRPSAII